MSPATPPLSGNLYATTSATTQIRNTIRPWSDLLDISALSLPISVSESTYRIKQNLHHFRGNYTIILLITLFLSLIFHPISIIVFLITFVAWLYLYLFREDDQLEIFGYAIGDRVVLIVMSVVSVGVLGLSRVWWNVVVSLMIGGLIVCFHALMRAPEDVDDMESPYGALLSVVDDTPQGPYTLA